MAKRPTIALLRANTFHSDTRTQKIYGVLEEIGKVRLILWNRDTVRETKPAGDRLYWSIGLGSLWFIPTLPVWFVFCFWQLLKLRPQIIHAADSEAMLPAFAYAKLFGAKTVFDIYDVTAGKYPLAPDSWLRRFFLRLDYFLLKMADAVVVPDPERLDQLELSGQLRQRVATKCQVIYNSDEIEERKVEATLPTNRPVRLVYVGTLNRNIRGLEFIIAAARQVGPTRLVIDLAGDGPDASSFKEQAKGLENITFHGRISHDQAMVLNEQADLMVSLLDPNFSNYRYATSTKAYEAMRLFKPIITTQGTATGRLVEETAWGRVIDYTEQAVTETLEELTSRPVVFTLDGRRATQYAWSAMRQRLKDLYDQL